MESLRSPSRSKNACRVAALRPGAPHDRSRTVVGDRGQIPLPASVGDLVAADRDQPVQPPLVEVIKDNPLHDLPDRVPRDSEQAGDRGLGHLLRQPRHGVLEVTRVVRVVPGPRHGLQMHTAVAAAKPAQLALDHAPVGAEIQMPPALQPAVMDLEPAGLTAAPAHSSAAPEPDGHDHPLGAEADIDNRRAGEAQKPIECGADAHLALLAGRLTFDSQQPAPQGGCASPRSAQPPTKTSAATSLLTRPTRPVLHPQTARRPARCLCWQRERSAGPG